MEEINTPSEFKDFIEIADFAQLKFKNVEDIDDLVQFVEEENKNLSKPVGDEDRDKLLNAISTNIRKRAVTFDPGKLDSILKNIEVPESKDDRIEPALAFAIGNLIKYRTPVSEVYIRTHVKKHFDISEKAADVVFRAFKDEQTSYKQNEKEAISEGKCEITACDGINEYPKDIVNRANSILENEGAFEFILGTWNKLHVGDRNIGENLLCSIAGTQILNTKLGLHIKPSGGSGTGKSDAIVNMLKLLPKNKYVEGSISSKALFYDESMKKGTIIYTDDVNLTDEIIATLRQLTSDYQSETIHRIIGSDLLSSVKAIPPRVTVWMSSVDGIQDEQLATRFFFGDTDGSTEQDEKVHAKQNLRAIKYVDIENDPDILTCRCILDVIFKNEYIIFAPLVNAISWNDSEHRRNYDKFLDLLMAVTVFNFRQRSLKSGGLVSTMGDFDRAIQIYNGTAANNACNLNGKEMDIMKVIQGSPGRTITFTEWQEKTGIKATSLRYAIEGRDGKEGLLGKVKGLYKLDKSETVALNGGDTRTTTKSVVYRYTGDLFELGSKLFQAVAVINRNLASTLTRNFMDTDHENDNNYHNSHTTITNDVIDKNDSSIDNNNNNNIQ